MDFSLFIQRLKEQLLKPLPGEPAQFKMAPPRRMTLIEYYQAANRNPKQSAVLICLYPLHHSAYTVLMLRPTEQGVHSDQVSFPGGRFEAEDLTPQRTALREAEEELNIDTEEIELLGPLTPLYIPVSNYMVNPFLAIATNRPAFKKNDSEVKAIIEADLKIFFDDAIKGHGYFRAANNLRIEAPYYEIQSHRIWGATAMMLSELEEILKSIRMS